MKSAETSGLTFHWPESRRISWLLPGFIALSFFLHALAFYVFQVVYPPSVSIMPPPAQVGLLMPSNPEHQALLHWIEAEDPAGVSEPPEVRPPKLLEVRYLPSYAELRTTPKAAVVVPQPVGFPAAKDAPAFVNTAVATPQETIAQIPAPGTIVRFSASLTSRGIKSSPPIHLTAKAAAHLVPTRFLVGVTGRGEVRYLFLQNGSGDKSIDRQAESNLAQIEFVPAAEAITWGFATYVWGDDAYAPRPPAR